MWSGFGSPPPCPQTNLSGLIGCLGVELAWLVHDMFYFMLSGLANTGASMVSASVACAQSIGSRSQECWPDAASWRPLESLGDLGIAFASHHPRSGTLVTGQRDVALLMLLVVSMLAAIVSLVRFLRSHLWGPSRFEVLFFPDESGANVQHVAASLRNAQRRVWVAMFAFSDDTLSDAVLEAHMRGVDVRVIVDDEQINNLGADANRLAAAGLPVVTDCSWAHMHHKFAVVDNVVLTGSFNWTRQASMANRENLVFLKQRAAVQAFAVEFEALWAEFSMSGKRLDVQPAGLCGCCRRSTRRSRAEAQGIAPRRRDKTPPPR